MPKYWMITNRSVGASGLGNDRTDLSFFVSDKPKVDDLGNWTKCSPTDFQKMLVEKAESFPAIPETEHEKQKHVSVFIHGYNNTWTDAALRYKQISDDLYTGPNGLGACILFNWPSNGSKFGYLPDREDAQSSGPDLARVFNALYNHAMLLQQTAADGGKVCKAKVSVIAHSMGNWVLQNALRYTWERQNKPLLMSLVSQCLMVAADVDNDLFAGGEVIGLGEGEGMANLCYRVAALYSGRDSVLGMSAGLKHFGKRRLGRTGLDREVTQPDNVCDFDCSALFPKTEKNIHSAYFWTKGTLAVLEDALRGYDRKIVKDRNAGVV
jgi:esterase/lipase superfamily enzyme